MLFLLSAAVSALGADIPDSAPVVGVTGGKIRGRSLPDGHSAVFKGIPFAQSPVGDLRWRETQPVVAWTGIREAAESGPPAAQPSQGWNDSFARASREDCLYLDVWTPTGQTKAHKPVMVWIHGGGNVAGAGGADSLYDGRALISHDVVLVVIEYRLGIFGFFALPELTRESPHHSSGNYAILDQIAALQWVHDNIEKFGGDPANVTLFGQSAGSIDILALMTSPLSRGLFHRAIGESGSLAVPSSNILSEREKVGQTAAGKLSVPPVQPLLKHLRSLTTEEVQKIDFRDHSFGIDQWVFTANPVEVFAQGKTHPVPLIIGGNAIEFPIGMFFPDQHKAVPAIFRDLAPKARALYGLEENAQPPDADPLYGDTADQLGSDLLRCPAVIEGEWHTRTGNPVWEYEFARAIPPNPKVSHSGDLPYVFGNLFAKGSQAGNFQPADHRLSETIRAYWTNFAKTGNPNGPGLPPWPNYDGKARKYLKFTTSADILIGENQRGPFCDLFRELLKQPAIVP